jgi:hypothetical protein
MLAGRRPAGTTRSNGYLPPGPDDRCRRATGPVEHGTGQIPDQGRDILSTNHGPIFLCGAPRPVLTQRRLPRSLPTNPARRSGLAVWLTIVSSSANVTIVAGR